MSDVNEQVVQQDEEEGNALSPTVTIDLDAPKQGDQPPQPKAEKGGKSPRADRGDLATRLERAEGAIKRHKDNSRELYEQLQQTRSSYAEREQQLQQLQAELSALKELRDRLAEGDEEALRALGGDFEMFIQRKLDPNFGHNRKVQTESDKRIIELEKKLQEREQREMEALYRQEVTNFLNITKEDSYPELHVVDAEDLVALAQAVAPQMKAQTGKAPTLSQLAAEMNRMLEGYHRRVFESYSSREQRRREAEAAAQAAPKGKVKNPETDVPPTLQKKTKPPVTTLPASAATQRASVDRKLTPEERRALAIKRFAQSTADE